MRGDVVAMRLANGHSGREKSYILYGTGVEAENFLFQHMDYIEKIEYCIDALHTGEFHHLPIIKVEEANFAKRKVIVAAGTEKTYFDMKGLLEKTGLKEFKDFVWSRIVDRKIVLVNANCHGAALIRYLEQSDRFSAEYAVYPLPAVHLNSQKEISLELLHNVDIYIHQDIRQENSIGYKLSDEYILPKLKEGCRSITIPNLVCMAHWMYPGLSILGRTMKAMDSSGYVFYKEEPLDKAVEMQCYTLEEYRDFWMNYVYTEEELTKKWKNDMDRLWKREANWDVKIAQFILDNHKKIPCFVDLSHPSKYVMREIGRQVAEMLSLDDIDDSEYESNLGVPVIPAVRKHFNFEFDVPCERRKYFGKKVVDDIDDYIRAYLWWMHEICIT